MDNNLKAKCDNIYAELHKEMYSERPNIKKLTFLVGKVESLREVLGYNVGEIEFAYILIGGWEK